MWRKTRPSCCCGHRNFALEPLSGWDTFGLRGTDSRGFVTGEVESGYVFADSGETALGRLVATNNLLQCAVWLGIAEVAGYQEVLTDPSYRGQIVAMTYPLIGNYGTNALDQESRMPHVRGFVIEELSEIPSNWRSELSLEDYLRQWKIPGVQGIDTRALTRHLRERGAMKACLTSEAMSAEEATRLAVEGEGVIGMDYVREVSTKEPYVWDPDDRLSEPWSITNGDDDRTKRKLPPIRFRVVAYDYGLKENILRRLRQNGFRRHRCSCGDERERCARAQSGRRFPFQRSGRSLRAALRASSRA